jgi:hypothetical protein
MLLAASCSAVSSTPPPLPEFTVQDAAGARSAAEGMASGSAAVFVCGPSTGQSYFLDPHQGWQDDGMTGGSTVLLRLPDGGWDVVFRDATGLFISSRRDGGIVSQSYAGDGNATIGIIVSFPSTGVVQTYSFIRNAPGGATLMMAQNKPTPSIFTRAGVYVSRCM